MTVFGGWVDVHGAGAQRSDPKTGNPATYPTGFGPQGDAIRIYNYVRLVRNADETTGIQEIDSKNQLNIYPNPVTDVCNIATSIESDQTKIKIFNASGNQVKEYKNVSLKSVQLDLEDLTTGIYFLNVSSENNLSTGKIIKL
jgi:hypothetical protein